MTKKELYDFLDEKGIVYETVENMPVYTIDEIPKEDVLYPDLIAKNLFVRDDKKRNYYLITVQKDRKVNLKEFQKQFETRRLSFASKKDLMEILKLPKGSVTPFGLLNDDECKVRLYIDRGFTDEKIGIHPMENTATVWINGKDLLSIIKDHGNSVIEF